MANFDLTPEEKSILSAAAASVKPWEHADWKPIKAKLKSHLKNKTNERCCYCRRSLHDTHNMAIDIEHVLPQAKFHKYVFALKNLSVACKRCNMSVKNQDYSFFSLTSGKRRPFRAKNFSILHPNLCNVDKHLTLVAFQAGTSRFVKYYCSKDHRAKQTYDYFKLREIETTAMDAAQGLRNQTEMKEQLGEIASLLERLGG
nr:hypothetical protein [Pseudomonas sp.]